MKKLLISLTILMTACAHRPTATTQNFVFDPQLLIPFEEAKNDVSTAQSPALYDFRSGDHRLLYLASHHSNDPKDSIFKMIDGVFQNEKIDVVIIEGFASDLGFNPESIKKVLAHELKDGKYPNGEPGYAMAAALKHNVPFIGGEPSDKQTFEIAKRNGFTANDLISFDFIRRMPQIVRSGEYDRKPIEDIYNDYASYKAKVYKSSEPTLSFKEFKEWYQKHQGKEFSKTAGEKGETAPMIGPYYTQKISIGVTMARDENIILQIGTMMSKYKNVLIIYGSSHYRIEHKAIKDRLGMPLPITQYGQ